MWLLALLTCMFAVQCGGGDNDEPSPGDKGSVTLSASELSFSFEGGSQSLTVSAPGEWDASCTESWIKLTKSNTLSTSGSITVAADENLSKNSRTATITVMSGSARAYVSVSQLGKPAEQHDPDMDVPDGYELVWHDEFDGTELNRADWTHEVQGPGWVNNELQHYVNGSFGGSPVTEVSDGTLKINCFKAANGNIYSGRIYANVSKGWTYGVFEASIKLPKGKGTWPAFWMMPANNDWGSTPWPKCGEIDIMEEVGYHPNYTSSSIHCEAYNHVKGTQKTAERLCPGAEDDFHLYRLEWTENYIRTYVDGKALLTFNNDGDGNFDTWPFKRPFYLILNLAWGGDWGGAMGVNEAALPVTMEVDYVRVFQKSSN